jgi:hypothetical protein
VECGTDYVEVIAQANIAAGEECTIDYALFEYALSYKDFACRCGNGVCRRRIGGYSDLPERWRRDNRRTTSRFLRTLDMAAR